MTCRPYGLSAPRAADGSRMSTIREGCLRIGRPVLARQIALSAADTSRANLFAWSARTTVIASCASVRALPGAAGTSVPGAARVGSTDVLATYQRETDHDD